MKRVKKAGPTEEKGIKNEPDDDKIARVALAKAVTLHRKHMNGTAKLTPASQTQIMTAMKAASKALSKDKD